MTGSSICRASGTLGACTILVVDDDQAVRDSLKRSLEYNGYEVSAAEDGVQALARLAAARPDAVIMDVMMPRLDGLETTRMLRAAGNDVPILVLTARDAVGDRVDGLDAGGDDYLAKPFALDELLARLRALVRRAGTVADSTDPSAQSLSFSDLVLNTQTREVLRGNRSINLTRTEFALLESFMRHPRRVLERSWLLNEVWGFDFPTTANSLEVYIGYLRRKTEASDEPRLIHTVRGVGYVLERRHHDQVAASERIFGECAVLRRLRAWLRALPLQRRVAYLTTRRGCPGRRGDERGWLRDAAHLAIPGPGCRDGPDRELACSGAGCAGHSDPRWSDRARVAGRQCQRGRHPERRRDLLRA